MHLLRGRIAVVVGLVAVYTVATVALPQARLSLFAPDLRVILETVTLCAAAFTALALRAPGRDGRPDPACAAFVAALVTIGLNNALFGIVPILVMGETATGTLFTFYPWLATRYAAAALFIAASVRTPTLSIRSYLAFSGAVCVAAAAAALVFRDALPLPLPLDEFASIRGGMVVDTTSVLVSLLVTGVPGLLFAAGAWLAWRAWLRSRSQIYAWLSLALWIRVVAFAHEMLYPAVLGPVVTSADAVRALSFAVLLVGAWRQLTELIRDRAATLRHQAEDLRSRDELLAAMRQFTEREQAFRSIVTHELSTPIATLRGFAQLLAHPADRLPEDRRSEALRGLEAESGRLLQLVERMDELRRLELDEFRCELRPVLLRPLLEDAALYVRGLPGAHPVQVTCAGVRVLGDPVRLGQALRNLVTNAARYSPDGTAIRLEASPGSEGVVEVSVVDKGPGIPAEEHRRVLSKYERGAAATGVEGAGLGLYVAERVAAAHGGRLVLKDNERANGLRAVLELKAAL